jgi:hypothetical protein
VERSADSLVRAFFQQMFSRYSWHFLNAEGYPRSVRLEIDLGNTPSRRLYSDKRT